LLIDIERPKINFTSNFDKKTSKIQTKTHSVLIDCALISDKKQLNINNQPLEITEKRLNIDD